MKLTPGDIPIVPELMPHYQALVSVVEAYKKKTADYDVHDSKIGTPAAEQIFHFCHKRDEPNRITWLLQFTPAKIAETIADLQKERAEVEKIRREAREILTMIREATENSDEEEVCVVFQGSNSLRNNQPSRGEATMSEEIRALKHQLQEAKNATDHAEALKLAAIHRSFE